VVRALCSYISILLLLGKQDTTIVLHHHHRIGEWCGSDVLSTTRQQPSMRKERAYVSSSFLRANISLTPQNYYLTRRTLSWQCCSREQCDCKERVSLLLGTLCEKACGRFSGASEEPAA